MNPIALGVPMVEPLTLAAAKAYLRVDGPDEDELISALIAAARLTVERATRLVLVEQSWRYRVPACPADGVVPLPLAPILAIDAVTSIDAAGIEATVDTDLYRLDASPDPARLLLDPPTGGRGLKVDLSCGFGAAAAAVPEPLRLAVRQLVALWFERRGDERPREARPLPASVESLLAPFVRRRLR